MHGMPKEVFTSKIWEQIKVFLDLYKKKEWLKFGMWTCKLYLVLNVIAIPNPDLSPCASMYRIKPERISVLIAKRNFYTMSSIKIRNIPYGKEVVKVMGQRYKIFCKREKY